MNVVAAAVHYFKKDAHENVEQINRAPALINPSRALSDLVDSILDTYNNRQAKQAGTFSPDVNIYPLAGELEEYLANRRSLLDVSVNVLPKLEEVMNLTHASTGGHIFFAHANDETEDFVLISKLTTAPGQIFQSLREVGDATHLSVENLQVAAKIDLTAWQTGQDDRYVTFVSKRSGGNTTNYFRDFIGCELTSESRTESKRLLMVIEDFFDKKLRAQEVTLEEIATRKRTVFDHSAAVSKRHEMLSLAEIAPQVWPADSDEFMTFLNAHKTPPADRFPPDKKSLRGLAEYSFNSKELKLTMSRNFKLEHNVTVTQEQLVIENPPQNLIDEFSD